MTIKFSSEVCLQNVTNVMYGPSLRWMEYYLIYKPADDSELTIPGGTFDLDGLMHLWMIEKEQALGFFLAAPILLQPKNILHAHWH